MTLDEAPAEILGYIIFGIAAIFTVGCVVVILNRQRFGIRAYNRALQLALVGMLVGGFGFGITIGAWITP